MLVGATDTGAAAEAAVSDPSSPKRRLVAGAAAAATAGAGFALTAVATAGGGADEWAVESSTTDALAGEETLPVVVT